MNWILDTCQMDEVSNLHYWASLKKQIQNQLHKLNYWVELITSMIIQVNTKKKLELLNDSIYEGLRLNNWGILSKFATLLWVTCCGHIAAFVEGMSSLSQRLWLFALERSGCTLKSPRSLRPRKSELALVLDCFAQCICLKLPWGVEHDVMNWEPVLYCTYYLFKCNFFPNLFLEYSGQLLGVEHYWAPYFKCLLWSFPHEEHSGAPANVPSLLIYLAIKLPSFW